jgi:hypothetical protein
MFPGYHTFAALSFSLTTGSPCLQVSPCQIAGEVRLLQPATRADTPRTSSCGCVVYTTSTWRDIEVPGKFSLNLKNAYLSSIFRVNRPGLEPGTPW